MIINFKGNLEVLEGILGISIGFSLSDFVCLLGTITCDENKSLCSFKVTGIYDCNP